MRGQKSAEFNVYKCIPLSYFAKWDLENMAGRNPLNSMFASDFWSDRDTNCLAPNEVLKLRFFLKHATLFSMEAISCENIDKRAIAFQYIMVQFNNMA